MFTSLIKARELGRNKRERGQGLVEYMLILILIAMAVVIIVGQLGQTVKEQMYDEISCGMTDAMNQVDPNC